MGANEDEGAGLGGRVGKWEGERDGAGVGTCGRKQRQRRLAMRGGILCEAVCCPPPFERASYMYCGLAASTARTPSRAGTTCVGTATTRKSSIAAFPAALLGLHMKRM